MLSNQIGTSDQSAKNDRTTAGQQEHQREDGKKRTFRVQRRANKDSACRRAVEVQWKEDCRQPSGQPGQERIEVDVGAEGLEGS